MEEIMLCNRKNGKKCCPKFGDAITQEGEKKYYISEDNDFIIFTKEQLVILYGVIKKELGL